MYLTNALHTSKATADGVSNLGDVHILVELIRIGDTSRDQGLSGGDQRVKRDRIDLLRDILCAKDWFVLTKGQRIKRALGQRLTSGKPKMEGFQVVGIWPATKRLNLRALGM